MKIWTPQKLIPIWYHERLMYKKLTFQSWASKTTCYCQYSHSSLEWLCQWERPSLLPALHKYTISIVLVFMIMHPTQGTSQLYGILCSMHTEGIGQAKLKIWFLPRDNAHTNRRAHRHAHTQDTDTVRC